MLRLRLNLAYDGSNFHGWGIQPDLRSVQGEVELALSKIIRSPIKVVVAGRTDAGVHAREQVVHFDLATKAYAALPGRSDRSPEISLLQRLVAVLPADIAATAATVVTSDFDARFSALSRTYKYRICDDLKFRSPLRKDVAFHKRPLNVELMNQAVKEIIGENDFLSFCKPRLDATTIRTVHNASWERPKDSTDANLVVATIEADAFCHHMVRSIVGASVAVGLGKADLAWMAALINNPRRDGQLSAPMFEASGLTLESVQYPPPAQWASRALQTRARRTLL